MAPSPGQHGGDGIRLARELGIDASLVLDLSASLNPAAPDPVPIVRRHADSVRHYPDAGMATVALAEAMGVDPDLLVLTNGGAEAIALVAQLRPEGWVEEPDFSLYRRHLTRVHPGAPTWRSNPHNPTGRLAADGARAEVWDEAFWPIATGTWSRGDGRHGSIVVGSLTKLLACPGLRVGYALLPDRVSAQQLRARQSQWAVNSLVAAALPALLDQIDLPSVAATVAQLRQELTTILERAGFEPQPSDANWVLVRHPDLREHLARQAIAVRDCCSFGLLDTVRIAVPDGAGLDRLARALQ